MDRRDAEKPLWGELLKPRSKWRISKNDPRIPHFSVPPQKKTSGDEGKSVVFRYNFWRRSS